MSNYCKRFGICIRFGNIRIDFFGVPIFRHGIRNAKTNNMKKQTKEEIWDWVLPLLALLLMILFSHIGRAQTYMVGTCSGWEKPTYVVTTDTGIVNALVREKIPSNHNAAKLASKRFYYAEHGESRAYIVTGTVKVKPNGKKVFVSNKPFKGLRNHKIKD